MYQMYVDTVLFPVAPGKLTVKINGNNKRLTLINEGEVNLIKSPGLTEISTEVLLPTLMEYPFAVYTNGFQSPDYYLEHLEQWKQEKKSVAFTLLRTSPNGEKLEWDTDIPVTIENYEIVEDAETQGQDVVVKISMLEYRQWGAKQLVIKKTKNINWSMKTLTASTKKTRSTKTAAKTYTVKKGDRLYLIAKKQLGDASRKEDIYKLNKTTMNKYAKKNGHKSAKEGTDYWIYPGEVLKLPKK